MKLPCEVLRMDLKRFVSAQSRDYETALAEIRAGRKASHWMWYIFPQVEGLGYSATAQYYALPDLAAAEEYYRHPVLGAHLIEISNALLELDSDNATQVLGYPDDLKLRSSMTLFMLAVPDEPVFRRVLEKYYHGEPDERTVEIVKRKAKCQ